jgi:NitT/TauT family transport system substrate-binding protein
MAAGLAGLARPAIAQALPKVTVGYTALSDFTSAFVAQEEGFFRARGLDVAFQLITLNSNIPAALQADSIQIGGPTASVMLLANQGGLDLVAIAGASVASRDLANFGLVQRTGAGMTDAKSVEGKRIGVPGLGAFLHVLFRKWMTDKGADWRKVIFVEVAIPQMADILRGGSVDGVIIASPIMERIVQGNIGTVVSYFHTELSSDVRAIVYATTRAWSEKNLGLVRSFREGLAQGTAFVEDRANDANVRAAMGKYIPLPPAVLATAMITKQKPTVTTEEMAYWVALMREQGMMQGQMQAERLVAR